MRQLCIRFFGLIRKDMTVRSEEKKKQIEELMNTPLMSDEKNALSVKAKSQFYYVAAKYTRLVGDMEQTLIFRQKHVKLIEDNPKFLEESKMTYLRTLNNLMAGQLEMDKRQEFEVTISKLRHQYHTSAPNERSFIFSSDLRVGMTYYLWYHLYNERKEEVKALEDRYNELYDDLRPSVQLVGTYYFAVLYFYTGEYDRALDYLNRMFEFEKKETLENILFIGKILYLIIHYELKNIEHLDHVLVSNYRYFYKKQAPFKAESAILKYFKKITQSPDHGETMENFNALHNELQPLMDEEYEAALFTEFDLMSWLESKIENRPLQDILKEKASLGH
jgi:hypothetical protein